jgi:hypothetical protein
MHTLRAAMKAFRGAAAHGGLIVLAVKPSIDNVGDLLDQLFKIAVV